MVKVLVYMSDYYSSSPLWERGISKVNDSSSKVTNHSNNATNLNSSLTKLNFNNTVSNTNTNISSKLLSLDVDCSRISNCILSPYLLVENKVWVSKYHRDSSGMSPVMKKAVRSRDMKAYYNLFEKIVTFENFKLAYKNAIKGKKHYVEVKKIEKYGVDKYLRELLKAVFKKEYVVSEYIVFQRFTGHKIREIYKLPMRDRIVQHALMNIIEPIFRETFIIDTFSSIKTKGVHIGLKRLKKAIKTGKYHYCLKLDIHKCYPSLDKEILKQKLSKKFKDPDLQWLLFEIIDSCEHGVPIGNYTSQYFNNFYFSDFDHWIKEVKGRKAYFRYCDDMVILGENKEELHNLFEEIKEKISKLNVSLKENHQIYSIEKEGVDFLGYVCYPDYIKIRKRTKQSFIKKINHMDLTNLSNKEVNVLGSYWGLLVHADCRHLWYKYIKMKNFKDLDISVHKRAFVKDIIGLPIIIRKSVIFSRKGIEWLKIEFNYKTDTEDTKTTITNTSGEKLVEAGRQFKASFYPFETVIERDSDGFYEFI